MPAMEHISPHTREESPAAPPSPPAREEREPTPAVLEEHEPSPPALPSPAALVTREPSLQATPSPVAPVTREPSSEPTTSASQSGSVLPQVLRSYQKEKEGSEIVNRWHAANKKSDEKAKKAKKDKS